MWAVVSCVEFLLHVRNFLSRFPFVPPAVLLIKSNIVCVRKSTIFLIPFSQIVLFNNSMELLNGLDLKKEKRKGFAKIIGHVRV